MFKCDETTFYLQIGSKFLGKNVKYVVYLKTKKNYSQNYLISFLIVLLFSREL